MACRGLRSDGSDLPGRLSVCRQRRVEPVRASCTQRLTQSGSIPEIRESGMKHANPRHALMFVTLGLLLVPIWMSGNRAGQQRITAPNPRPRESYAHPPDAPFDRSDYVIKINQMSSFYDKPGEFGYAIHGEDYGFDRLSFVVTET